MKKNLQLSPKRQERLDDIYRLHKEGKSTQEITDFMNQKYGTTLRTNRPYYPQLFGFLWISTRNTRNDYWIMKKR